MNHPSKGWFAPGLHAVAFRPEAPAPELVLEVGALAEHHERALPFEVPHEARDADLRRDGDGHVRVVGHRAPLDCPHALVAAQLPQDLAERLPALVVDDFSPILRCERDTVLAESN